jgi:hypothetical protein
VTIAFRLPAGALPVRTVRSARHRLDVHLFLHSNDEGMRAACEDLADSPNVRLYDYGFNRGVARSWNEGILNGYDEGADVVVVCNDDVAFSDGDLDQLVDTALANRDCHIVACAGFHRGGLVPTTSLEYSCFAINPLSLETIGCFDENFFPGYFEDCDHTRRADLAGLRTGVCATTKVRHWGPGVPWRSAFAGPEPDPGGELQRQTALSWPRNIDYYRRKWGGDHGSERFSRPFDEPRFDLRIAPEARHAPYGPGHDRTDYSTTGTLKIAD